MSSVVSPKPVVRESDRDSAVGDVPAQLERAGAAVCGELARHDGGGAPVLGEVAAFVEDQLDRVLVVVIGGDQAGIRTHPPAAARRR